MSWDFTVLDRNELYTLSLAAPRAGDETTFEVAGWEVEPNLVRNGGITYQLSGASEVQFIDRPDSSIARYSGFADRDAFTGDHLVRAPGLARSIVTEDLEYICFTPANKTRLLNAATLKIPEDPVADYAGHRFVVLDGFVELDGERLERLQAGVISGPLSGDGVVAVLWGEARPANVKWVPARPEALVEAARKNPTLDTRPHRTRGRLRLAQRRPGKARPPPPW